jgi:predicted nucleic acid-binding protein
MSGPNVIVDTNIFVSARNPFEAGHGTCRRLLDRIDAGKISALVSTITLAEIRSGLGPAEARAVWQALLSHFLTSSNYSIEPVDAEIAERAGELRQQTRLTLPDALIVATGQLRGAVAVVTQDHELGRRQSVLPTRDPSAVD